MSTAKKVKQSIDMYVRNLDIYVKLYANKSSGMHEAVNAFLPLRFHTIKEIREIGFSKEELTALTDHLRYVPLQDPVNLIEKDTLIKHIRNSKEWDNLEKSHKIVYDDLISKLKKLTAAQVYFLQSEIARYWKLKKGKHSKIDAFVETLL